MTSPASASAAPAVRHALSLLAAGRGLDEASATSAFEEIMAGVAGPASLGALLLGLRTRGESPEEIAGAVRALRGAMRRVHHPAPERLVDTCGTGGGKVGTLNLSTAAAFVAAGAGVEVAKHGNRSFTSRSGSADVLEALGIRVDITPELASEVLVRAGIVFLYAPTYHPAMRHVAPVRRELGVPTIMNLVGPLANPALAGRQVVGVADRERAPRMAGALARLGSAHALVVHAEIGMDEIAPLGTTAIWEVRDGGVTEWTLDPTALGLTVHSLDGLEGGAPEENAATLERLFAGASSSAAVEAAVLLNAAAAIYVSGKVGSMADGVAAARAALQEGRAADRLAALRSATR
jgi:anthranilate phosphoribosyltransferase